MKKIYSAPARYIFEGTFKVEAERSEEASVMQNHKTLWKGHVQWHTDHFVIP